jgi:hypothetical protein
MILLLAEAELKLNNPTRALELVNEVRQARQLPEASEADFGVTFDERLDYILVERQLELFGEGKRWWDLVRNDRAIPTINAILALRDGGQTLLTENRIFWPILIEHLDENENLRQNPGWSDASNTGDQ